MFAYQGHESAKTRESYIHRFCMLTMMNRIIFKLFLRNQVSTPKNIIKRTHFFLQPFLYQTFDMNPDIMNTNSTMNTSAETKVRKIFGFVPKLAKELALVCFPENVSVKPRPNLTANVYDAADPENHNISVPAMLCARGMSPEQWPEEGVRLATEEERLGFAMMNNCVRIMAIMHGLFKWIEEHNDFIRSAIWHDATVIPSRFYLERNHNCEDPWLSGHSILVVATITGAQFVIDPTAQQFGWPDWLYPREDYVSEKVAGPNEGREPHIWDLEATFPENEFQPLGHLHLENYKDFIEQERDMVEWVFLTWKESLAGNQLQMVRNLPQEDVDRLWDSFMEAYAPEMEGFYTGVSLYGEDNVEGEEVGREIGQQLNPYLDSLPRRL